MTHRPAQWSGYTALGNYQNQYQYCISHVEAIHISELPYKLPWNLHNLLCRLILLTLIFRDSEMLFKCKDEVGCFY